MKTIVLLPAHNEALSIGNTLSRLPSEIVEPIVVANGCEDDTRSIAESYGAEVYDYDEQGKLPAIQATLKQLGRRALEPMLLLDADSYPINPEKWHTCLLGSLTQDERPTYVSAPVVFSRRPEGTKTEAAALTAFRHIGGLLRRTKTIEKGTAAYYGPNQGMKLSPESLDRVLDLPHYWPKEDVAMARAIIGEEEGTMYQLRSLGSAVMSQVSEAMPPFHYWVTKSPRRIDEIITKKYRDLAPKDSV